MENLQGAAGAAISSGPAPVPKPSSTPQKLLHVRVAEVEESVQTHGRLLQGASNQVSDLWRAISEIRANLGLAD
jgi:hypothetical protein